MLIVAGVAGSLYAAIATFFKHKFSMDEFITTLMLNFVAEYFITYLVSNPLKDSGAAWPMSPVISEKGVFSQVGGIDFSVFISIFVFATLFAFWRKTRTGYELRMQGSNKLFSRAGGCEVSRNFVSSMMLSGFLAGLAGAFLIMGSGQQNKLIPSLGKVNADDGIMIALISGNSLLSVVIFSVFFGIIQTGAVGMQLETNVPMEFTIMLQAMMVLLVVAFRDYSDIFINNFKAWKRRRINLKLKKKPEMVRGEISESFSGDY